MKLKTPEQIAFAIVTTQPGIGWSAAEALIKDIAQAIRERDEEVKEACISEAHNHRNEDGVMLRHNIENGIRALDLKNTHITPEDAALIRKVNGKKEGG